MASSSSSQIHKQSFSVLSLPTRSVTFYPTTALVVRDIPNVAVKPGINEYTIRSLTQYALPNSFKVEGHGTNATIVNTSVEYAYSPADSDSDSDNDTPSSESESDEEEEDPADLEAVRDKEAALRAQRATLDWEMQTITNEMSAWEAYGRTITTHPAHRSRDSSSSEPPVAVEWVQTFLGQYNEFRGRAGERQAAIKTELAGVARKMAEAERERVKIEKRIAKARAKTQKVREKMRRRKQERDRKKKGVYPQYVLTVTVEAETMPADAPKVEAKVDTGKPKLLDDGRPPPEFQAPSLRISYSVNQAGWVPKYELSFDTIARTGVLTYRAEVKNETGEDWNDASVALSTNQTRFRDVGQMVPGLVEWKIGMGKKPFSAPDCLLSRSEITAPANIEQPARRKKAVPPPPPPRQQQQASARMVSGGLFGSSSNSNTSGFGQRSAVAPAQLFGNISPPPAPPGGSPCLPQAAFGAAAPQAPSAAPTLGGLFGRSAAPRPADVDLFTSDRSLPVSAPLPDGSHISEDDDEDDTTTIASLPFDPTARMSLASTTTDSHGITTTFSLPSKKNLPTSPTPLRYLVSETPLGNIDFVHTIVPKIRAAAFLTATLNLPPTAPKLPYQDPVLLRVDNTHLGTVAAPFELFGRRMDFSLGVDDGVTVRYARPKQKVQTQGFVNKVEVTKHTRSFDVVNRTGKKITVVVRDQVPVVEEGVSEDRGVKVVVLKPEGLEELGDGKVVNVGQGGTCRLLARVVGRDRVPEWRWEVERDDVRKGVLEFEVRAPVGERDEGVVTVA